MSAETNIVRYTNKFYAAVHRAVDAVNDYTTEAYFFPKRALIDRPKAAFIAARDFAEKKISDRLPSYVPRDATTGRIIGTGATVYALDAWNPTSPVGEGTLITCFGLACVRGLYIVARNARATTNEAGITELGLNDNRQQALPTSPSSAQVLALDEVK